MTSNVSLIDEVNAWVSPVIIATISNDLGGSPFQTSGATRRAIPTVLAGLMDAAWTEGGASRVLHAAIQAHETGILDRAHVVDAEQTRRIGAQGERMLGFVFGERAMEAIDAIARSSATSREVAYRALGTVSPIALAVIGREAIARQLDASGLMQFLRDQRPAVIASPDLPRDAALGRIVRGAEPVSVTERPVARSERDAPPPRRSSAALGWLLALVGLLAILLLLMTGIGATRRAREHASNQSQSQSANEPPTVGPPIAGPPPEGTSSDEQTSTTTTTGAAVELPDWSAHKLTFQAASTKLTSEGEESIKAVADLLIANPNERIKLVGHSDAIGQKNVHADLAMNRAAIVQKELVARGVDPSRIDLSATSDETKVSGGRNRQVEVMPAPH